MTIFSTITWDLTAITGELSGLGTALMTAGSLAILGALVLFGLQRAVKFALGVFKETAGDGHANPDGWRAKVPPMSGSWKGNQEGWENDWRGRHPKAFHGKW